MLDDRIEHFQRLVVNPFLAVFCVLATWKILFRLTHGHPTVAVVLSFLALPIPYLLLQFHCRDCGRTGMYRNWPRHECEMVALRRREGVRRRWRRPSPGFQLRVWFLLLGAAVFLHAIIALARDHR
ncbi:hypothetical protein EP7_003693 [Isosphaeraceae bacterium EP7]